MNSCLQCGKEIPERSKFCSRSCSAKYNNARRTRKPWTEEQRQAASAQRKQHWFDTHTAEEARLREQKTHKKCQYCGQDIVSHGKTCKECQKWEYPVVFKRLGLVKGSAKERFEKALEIVRQMYFQDKFSIPQIREKTGLHYGSIRYLITYRGDNTRGHAEGQRNAIEQGRWTTTPNNPFYKSGKHTSWQGDTYTFRSSWEEQLMQELDERKIPYAYEPFRLRYFDSQKQEERVAVPDFFFPESNTILELKSSWTYDEQNMKDRFNCYRRRGYKVKLLLDWVETEI